MLLWYICGAVWDPGGVFLFVLSDIYSVFRFFFSTPFILSVPVCKYTEGIKDKEAHQDIWTSPEDLNAAIKKPISSAYIDKYSILLCKQIRKAGFTWKMIHLQNKMKFLFAIKGIQLL